MKEIIGYINTIVPDKFTKLTSFIKISPGELAVVVSIILLMILLNWFMRRPLLKRVKIYLYMHRKNILYRILYQHINSIIRPFRLIITLFLLKYAITTITITKTLDTLFFGLYWLFFFWLIYEIVKFLLYTMLAAKIKRQKSARMELYILFLNITKVIITFLLIILVMSHMGIDLTALITSLGIGGAILGLSAKDTLTNFFDSIRIISEDAFRQGDWIETKDIEGFVIEIGLTATKIRTFDNALVTVPNTKIVNDYIKNWTRRMMGRRIKFHIRIKYTNDITEIERVLYEIHNMLHSHPDIVNENKIRYLKHMKRIYETGLFNLDDKYGVRRTLLVYLDEIDIYSMNILIYAFSISVNWEEWLRVKQDVIKRIIKIIDDSKLELAVPLNEILLYESTKKVS